MSVTYQRPAGPGDWGRIVVGERRVPLRLAVLIGGVTVWLGLMLITTGAHGVTALWTNLYFLGALLLLTIGTQTIGLRWVAFFFLVGGLTMALMLPLGAALEAIGVLGGVTGPALIIPILEEAAKIVPVLVMLWWWRRDRAWSLSASDVLLMAAAIGAGFGMVEDAYIRRDFGWPDQLAWLPVTEIIGGQMIAGHGIWTAIAGATIGLALLLRARGRRLVLLVGATGFIVATLDHIRNNYSNRFGDLLAGLLEGIGLHGWLVIYLFLALAAAVIVADAWVIYRSSPRPPEHNAPPLGGGVEGWRRAWAFRLARRALALANFQLHRASGADLEQAGWVALRLDLSLKVAERRREGVTE